MVFQDLHAFEQLRQVRGDDVFDGDETLAAEFGEARQRRGDFDARERLPSRVVEGAPGNVGERVGRVDGERGEHRVDRAAEEAVHLLLLFGGEVVPAHDADPGFGERRRYRGVEACRVPFHELVGDFADLP